MKEKLRNLFFKSFDIFLEKEKSIILDDINERTLCAKLAECIGCLLSEYGLDRYYSDVEYNRKQEGRIKTILNERSEVVNINCDLLVHSRGEILPDDNLIAVEMKKIKRLPMMRPKRNYQPLENDRVRLRALTKKSFDGIWSADGRTHPEHVCGYYLGYLIIICTENASCRIEEFSLGELVSVFEYAGIDGQEAPSHDSLIEQDRPVSYRNRRLSDARQGDLFESEPER